MTKKKAPNSFVVFNKEQTRDLLKTFGYVPKHVYVYDKRGQRVTCDSCKDELRVDSIGNVVPGNPGSHLLCTKLTCFAQWWAVNRI